MTFFTSFLLLLLTSARLILANFIMNPSELNDHSGGDDNFEKWIMSNGGDSELLDVLKKNGFSSKLSLKKADFQCPEGKAILADLSYGKKCLLNALMEALDEGGDQRSTGNLDTSYEKVAAKAAALSSHKAGPGNTSIRDKIGKLFHFQSGSSTSITNSDDDFEPSQLSFRSKGKRSVKRRGGMEFSKGPSRKKVKQAILSVVGLAEFTNRTPTGAGRTDLTRDVWINHGASEEVLRAKIAEAFNWKNIDMQFLLANGKRLRKATLQDVENSTSWDLETVKLLMGTGALYVVKPADVTSPCKDKPDSDYTPQVDEDVALLMEMFPNESIEDTKELLSRGNTVNDVVEILAGPSSHKDDTILSSLYSFKDVIVTKSDQNEPYFASSSLPVPVIAAGGKQEDLQGIVRNYSSKVVDEFSEFSLFVDRSTPEKFWMAVQAFYKGAIQNVDKLKRCLVVHYEDEDGSDAGALRKEFFEDSLKEVSCHCFEGDEGRKIPKKDIALEGLSRVAGIIVAHSILQEGPGFPCLSPVVFDYLIHGDTTKCFPLKEDIPLNASTAELLTVIQKLDDANSDEDIDAVLEMPSVMAIINSSRWSITELITKSSKSALLQQLLREEVVDRREKNFQAFSEGLATLGLVQLLRQYPTLTRPLLVAQNDIVLTSKVFVSLMHSTKPTLDEEKQAYEFFKEFIVYIEETPTDNVALPSILRFITGCSSVPPMGLKYPISVSYYSKSSGKQLPGAAACSNTVFLPTCHTEKSDFFSKFMKAIEYGGTGFGCP